MASIWKKGQWCWERSNLGARPGEPRGRTFETKENTGLDAQREAEPKVCASKWGPGGRVTFKSNYGALIRSVDSRGYGHLSGPPRTSAESSAFPGSYVQTPRFLRNTGM